ncbi:hypothetical protein X805_35930 [Sphaerotilus natans subsp. natans DSM 6575]|uniref:Uncharacterized protein n=1 Tax=Sphaerotilus natans subsp. natans DSM 6575 TaxID=1286631 RepID=A0A059KH58_9BURK|nr:hypothetical protein X805_35930 [Sphaerotilus natans subsp. natans DSM 6575]
MDGVGGGIDRKKTGRGHGAERATAVRQCSGALPGRAIHAGSRPEPEKARSEEGLSVNRSGS